VLVSSFVFFFLEGPYAIDQSYAFLIVGRIRQVFQIRAGIFAKIEEPLTECVPNIVTVKISTLGKKANVVTKR